VLGSLRALLDNFGRDADGTGSDLSHTRRQHMYAGLSTFIYTITAIITIGFPLCVSGDAVAGSDEMSFDGIISDEEEGCAGGGSNERGAYATIDSGEAARCCEPGG
jgi:hypothetical protein